MRRTLHDDGVLAMKYVVADGLDGHSPTCLEAIEHDGELLDVVAIPADTRGWLQGPVLETKPYRDKGAVHTKQQGTAKDSEPPAVEAIATGMHDGFW